MDVTDVQQLSHLEQIIVGLSEQRARLSETFTQYRRLSERLRERRIDQTGLVSSSQDQDEQEVFQKLLTEIEAHIKKTTEIQTEISEDLDQLFTLVHYHLSQHTMTEVANAGFVSHLMTPEDQVSYDVQRNILEFKEKGTATASIANNLPKWRDASQIEIIPVRGELSK